MTTQTEAQRLAEKLKSYSLRSGYAWHCHKAADELRRLDAELRALRGDVPAGMDDYELSELAHSANQEALSFGLSHDVFLRYFKTIRDKALAAAPQPAAPPLTKGIPSTVEAVEFRREQYALNCAQWAYVLGMNPTHYSEFVHGHRSIPKEAMAQAYAYGVPAEALFQQRPTKGSWDIDRRLKAMQEAAIGSKKGTT
jgi:hypothetical protein